jgi:NAD(P)-dependent dehydrogenase (short-subunit alcohol dehydrogenase family)
MRRRADFDLTGATALVTGAGSGIGRAVAVELARKGSRVVAVDVCGETAEKTALACGEAGLDAEAMACDVSDNDAVVALAARVAAEVGPLDVLVNNAGVGMSARLTDMALDDWHWIRGVNLDGVLHCCLAFGPAMLERGHGHVVNVSSGLAYTPRATEPAYVTTKAGVLALSRCLRADWGRSGVGVSAVCPGVIDTPIIDATRFLGDQAATAEKTRTWFARGHPPELVAADVIVAIRHDKAVVPVGWEAKLGWWAQRFAPLRVQDAVARFGL